MLLTNKLSKILTLSLLFFGVISLSGCARDISARSYSDAQVGEVSQSFQGVVINARKVRVKAENKTDNLAGIGLGAASGGLLGSAVRGKSRGAAIVGGAVLGGVAGSFAQDYLRDQDGMEYVVRLFDGSLRTVVQGLDLVYAPGQRVILIISGRGRSRLIPDNSVSLGLSN